jgi:hypothetical protein
MHRDSHPLLVLATLPLLGLAAESVAAEPGPSALQLYPAQVTLRGQADRQRFLVTGVVAGRPADLSRTVQYHSESPAVVRVDAAGVATPVADGTGTVVATFGKLQARATVQVVEGTFQRPIDFERDVVPVLTRAGCNAGACHGKARGQNGFQLSLLGFDRDFDYGAIVKEARGRRVFPAAPEQSLLLLKPTGQLPHGGGKRLRLDEPAYAILLQWIREGLPRSQPNTAILQHITIEPSERILSTHGEQQLVVTGHYSDGSQRDVTHLTTFQSNESVIAAVNPDGLVQASPLPGEAAIMARFMEKFAVCNVVIPLAGQVAPEVYARLPRNNFIDGLVWEKLQQLGITPSEPAGDATFLRRAYLDAIGRLPTPAETRAFLADPATNKRERLVERLLQRPEYADYWANKWADLLRPNPYRVGIKAVYNLDAWLRAAFRRNMPYDQFVRELITARGSTFHNGATVIHRDRPDPPEITTLVSQLFLGIRLECAKCHHHPFEVWSQDDFYSLSAYFARIGRKGTGLSPPISGGEQMFFTAKQGDVRHPVTNQVLPPRPLFGKNRTDPDAGDRRQALAAWVVSDDNPYFARVLVNRVWADLMGRGLVEPVDDLRATNPPSNGPLLDALADRFRRERYDLKKLLQTIMTSYAYGLSSNPNERNVADTRNYSRHYRQRLRAEVLLDAVCDVTGVPESFPAMPEGSRAMSLWTFRSQSVFLDSFGRPDPNQDPPCERTSDPTVVQALHLMNAPGLHHKIIDDAGRAAKLAAGKKAPDEIVDELYALVYCRPPTEEERHVCLELYQEKDATRRRVTEDLLWALLNTPEFLFKD